ncbi:hypothetical protein HMPREF9080_01619 [Cardiobacterium valvarum F0432]|uniref:Uncharacterized protein n=1 Tax=Cardiobacterium valvarum F0432 TaxID=797473 RepID=G9ZFQ6_9GAMM|nr:hypothetical protein HMPREF9080_01619 [Cardiobacterium valvarum F0432]
MLDFVETLPAKFPFQPSLFHTLSSGVNTEPSRWTVWLGENRLTQCR